MRLRRDRNVRSAQDGFAAANLLAATLLAADPAMFPLGSLPAVWSDLVLTRAAERDEAEASPLSARRAA
jgi:hypothetical protein